MQFINTIQATKYSSNITHKINSQSNNLNNQPHLKS